MKVTVTMPGGEVELPADASPHHHDHHHHHHHPGPHRHVSELLGVVRNADLSPWVKDRALQAFTLLGEAEGRVHGVPPLDVPLHEVGAVDALVDIVGTIEGFAELGVTDIATRPVALGSGWVHAAHGVLPVPAPATSYLLEGLPIGPNGPVIGEATTPTGATLLRVLVNRPVPDLWRATGQGWGAGTRNPPGYPNALRLLLVEASVEAGEALVIATDVDDMAPEYLEPLREALSAAGALDVQWWTTMMKKGRPGFRIEALVPPQSEEAVTQAFLRHSTTLGVRRWSARRTTVPRREVVVPDGLGGHIRVKVSDTPGGLRLKPEYDDVVAAARQRGVPALEVAESVREHAQLLARTLAAGSTPAHKESE